MVAVIIICAPFFIAAVPVLAGGFLGLVIALVIIPGIAWFISKCLGN